MIIVMNCTDEQLANLKALLAMGDNNLPKIAENYATDNLWQVDDVRLKHPHLTDDECLTILSYVLESERLCEDIFDNIYDEAIDMSKEIIEECWQVMNGAKSEDYTPESAADLGQKIIATYGEMVEESQLGAKWEWEVGDEIYCFHSAYVGFEKKETE